MKTVAVLSFTPLDTDPRVNRQIRFLCEEYHVIALGTRSPEIKGVRFVPLTYPRLPFLPRKWHRMFRFKRLGWLLLLLRRYEAFYWTQLYHRQVLKTLSRVRADLIIANDLETLPIALRGANGAKVVFDAHEYTPREFEERFSFRFFFQRYYEHQCRKYIPQTHAMMTVCEGIAERYASDTGVKPEVVTNACPYVGIDPVYAKGNKRIRLVHHGGAIPSRRLEKMIRMMDFLDDRFELNLMLVETDLEYMGQLRETAKGRSDVRFLPPVRMEELPKFLSEFHVGVYLLEPGSFNNLHALPNKIFEFIQARLAIAIGPSPEMARIVRDYDCGVVSEDFTPEALARCIQDLDARTINAFKERAHLHARELSAERNREILRELVQRAIGS